MEIVLLGRDHKPWVNGNSSLGKNFAFHPRQLKLFPGHSEESSVFPNICALVVVVFWLKWAGYLGVAGLNLLSLLSDRVSPGSV